MKKTIPLIMRILSYVKTKKKYLYASIIFSILGVVCNLLCPFLIGKAIDNMLGFNAVKLEEVFKLAIIIAALYIASAICTYVASYNGAKLAESTILLLRRQYMQKLHSCPIQYLDGNATGELLSRMILDIESVGSGLMQGLTELFSGVATIIVTLVIMYFINPIIASIIVVITPLSLFVTFVIARKSQKLYGTQQQRLGDTNAYIEERLSSIKLIKCYGQQHNVQQTFESKNSSLADIMQRAHFTAALTNPSIRLINNFVYVISGIMGVLLKCTVGQISSFLLYANQYTKPFNTVTAVITEIQLAVAAAARVFEVFDSKDQPADDIDAKTIDSTVQKITFEDVKFSYCKEKPLISNFNLNVERGKKIAIVGPTGAGKTTIVNLLMRFYDVDEGCILMDGVDIRNIKRNSLREEFGMVLQDTFLFGVSIFDNLSYGNQNATLDDVIAVAKECHCHSFIMNMAKGYETVLDDSVSLSQGQIQLISIARAMLSKPSMLILDEATSSIDSLSELKVQEAFDKLMKNKTSFIIAHRLSTIMSADTILVMKDGNIIEQGDHKQLLQQKGFYYELYNSQFN